MRNLPFADKCFSLCGFIQNDLIFSFQMENRCGTLWDMCRTCFHISVIIKRQLRHYRIRISFFHLVVDSASKKSTICRQIKATSSIHIEAIADEYNYAFNNL